jgi:hypothetical protein
MRRARRRGRYVVSLDRLVGFRLWTRTLPGWSSHPAPSRGACHSSTAPLNSIAQGAPFPNRGSPRTPTGIPSGRPWNWVEVGEYRGVVRVPRRVFQRLLSETPTPERCVERYYLQRTRFESIAERKLRRPQLTETGISRSAGGICAKHQVETVPTAEECLKSTHCSHSLLLKATAAHAPLRPLTGPARNGVPQMESGRSRFARRVMPMRDHYSLPAQSYLLCAFN